MPTKKQKLIKPKYILVIKINVGNLKPKDVDEYMSKTMNKLKKDEKFDTSEIMIYYIPTRHHETGVEVHKL